MCDEGGLTTKQGGEFVLSGETKCLSVQDDKYAVIRRQFQLEEAGEPQSMAFTVNKFKDNVDAAYECVNTTYQNKIRSNCTKVTC